MEPVFGSRPPAGQKVVDDALPATNELRVAANVPADNIAIARELHSELVVPSRSSGRKLASRPHVTGTGVADDVAVNQKLHVAANDAADKFASAQELPHDSARASRPRELQVAVNVAVERSANAQELQSEPALTSRSHELHEAANIAAGSAACAQELQSEPAVDSQEHIRKKVIADSSRASDERHVAASIASDNVGVAHELQLKSAIASRIHAPKAATAQDLHAAAKVANDKVVFAQELPLEPVISSPPHVPKKLVSDKLTAARELRASANVPPDKIALAQEVQSSVARILAAERALAESNHDCIPVAPHSPELMSKGSCHVGYYTHSQIIGSLLHLAVQLLLFPPQAPHSDAIKTEDQACQTMAEQACQTMGEKACQTMVEQGCQTMVDDKACQTIAEETCRTMVEQGWQTTDEKAYQTMAEETCQTMVEEGLPNKGRKTEQSSQAVRVGGGFYVVRTPRRSADDNLGKHRTIGIPCGAPLRATHALRANVNAVISSVDDRGNAEVAGKTRDTSLIPPTSATDHSDNVQGGDATKADAAGDYQMLDSFAHGKPGRDSRIERFKVDARNASVPCRPDGKPEGAQLNHVMRGRPSSAEPQRSYPRVGGPPQTSRR